MEVLEIIKTGLGASIQDLGRIGWKRFGVPPSGVMDPHAAVWANRLVGNSDGVPVLELLMQGAELRVLTERRFAVTGAEAGAAVPAWRARTMAPGTALSFPHGAHGLWTYVAVHGGFDVDEIMDSSSAYPRGGIGHALRAGDRLSAGSDTEAAHVGESWTSWNEQRDYGSPPLMKVWRGPQWTWFDAAERRCFLDAEWEVSSRSDRVGYRLEGARLNAPAEEMRSEPVLVGSIQVPPNGQPIVTMRDGPTVGGYPKIGIVDPESLSWLVQCRPGVRFRWVPAE
ncbi:MAG TPA: biotin-dependent carboxyltransferase family protein [Chthoniobacterales bacterium]|nr:biotin-dependent carboxyltransferase family protein [Chthoniobacterales bacterium]